MPDNVEKLGDLLPRDQPVGRDRVIVMCETEFAARRDLLVIPWRAGVRTPQIKHRLDAVLLRRDDEVLAAGLRRAVEHTRLDRMEIALVDDHAAIRAD